MHKHYLDLFNLEYNGTLYNSTINDKDRMIITRWRLSVHHLFIETGRCQNLKVDANERKSIICNKLEDEENALFKCCVHRCVQDHLNCFILFRTWDHSLTPKKIEDITNLARFLRDIEKNMEKMKMLHNCFIR